MFNSDEFDMTRSAVPNSGNLQASIIAKAESLPQHPELGMSSATPKKNWFRVIRIALPLAACCVFALAMVISPDYWTGAKPELSNTLVVNEDSDWQEIMFLEDEWLFAD